MVIGASTLPVRESEMEMNTKSREAAEAECVQNMEELKPHLVNTSKKTNDLASLALDIQGNQKRTEVKTETTEELQKNIAAIQGQNERNVDEIVGTQVDQEQRIDSLENGIRPTIEKYLKRSCYVILGCVAGCVVGGALAFAFNKDPLAGGVFGLVAGGIATAALVHCLSKKYLPCCSQ